MEYFWKHLQIIKMWNIYIGFLAKTCITSIGLFKKTVGILDTGSNFLTHFVMKKISTSSFLYNG